MAETKTGTAVPPGGRAKTYALANLPSAGWFVVIYRRVLDVSGGQGLRVFKERWPVVGWAVDADDSARFEPIVKTPAGVMVLDTAIRDGVIPENHLHDLEGPVVPTHLPAGMLAADDPRALAAEPKASQSKTPAVDVGNPVPSQAAAVVSEVGGSPSAADRSAAAAPSIPKEAAAVDRAPTDERADAAARPSPSTAKDVVPATSTPAVLEHVWKTEGDIESAMITGPKGTKGAPAYRRGYIWKARCARCGATSVGKTFGIPSDKGVMPIAKPCREPTPRGTEKLAMKAVHTTAKQPPVVVEVSRPHDWRVVGPRENVGSDTLSGKPSAYDPFVGPLSTDMEQVVRVKCARCGAKSYGQNLDGEGKPSRVAPLAPSCDEVVTTRIKKK